MEMKPKTASGSQAAAAAPGVPTHVIVKLAIATLAMIVLPIGSYFLLVDSVFGGNTTYAAGCAALMANMVLVGFVIVAWNEEQDYMAKDSAGETKKSK